MSAGFQLARAMSGALLVLGLAAQQSAPLNQDGNAEQALRQELERRPGDVVALSRLGGVLDSQQKCAEAERVYRIALSRQPPSPALLNNLGNHYLACGDPREARAWFERLLRINPAHNNANLQMARIAVDQKHGVQALGYLAHIRESGPAIDLLRAEALYWSGQRDSALATLDRIGREAAGDARVLFSLGLLYARLERYDRAEAAFQALLAEHPAELEVALNLGRAALRAGHYERAQQVLEAALKRQPECVDALSELGQLHAALHDYDRAVLLLARARKLAPKRADILLWLARAAADASYYGDSVQAYDEYLSLRPDDDEVRRDRAVTYARMERNYPDVGLKELLRYVERHPADPLGHYDLALVYGYTDQEKALRELTEALRLDPALGPAHYARALLLHTADSIPDLEVVLRLNPQDTRALDQLGRIYLALEKPAEAERVLRQALAISPDFPEGLMDLGRALIEQGRKDEGVSYLQRFRDLRSQRQPFYGPWLIEAAGMPPGEVRRRVIEGLRQTCRARPDDADVRLELGTVLLSQGQVEEASAVLRELLALKAGAQTLHKAGLLLLRSEQYGLARELLERAAAERPSARLDLAIALLFADSAERALECLEAIPERERSGDYYLLKAQIGRAHV